MGTLTLNLQRNREAKNPAAQEIDDETYFRYFYLPHIITDVFYDYTDTVICQSVQMRIEPMKKVTRKLKELKADYYYLRNRHFNFNTRTSANNHMELFIESYSEEFENEFKLIRWGVSNKRKQLHPDWLVFISSVYMGIVIYKALHEYAKEADKGIEKIWGPSRHSIIPDFVDKSYLLLKEYLGDCQVLTEEDISSSSKRILELIRRVGFTGELEKS